MPTPQKETGHAPPAAAGDARAARGWLAPAVLAVLTLALLGRLAFFDFVDLDDVQAVVTNPLVASLSPGRIFGSFFATSYYPVRLFSFALDRSIWGPGAMGFHVVNVLIHAANALLLYFLVLRLAGPGKKAARQAFWAGALFALHPVAAATTAWIPGREELLSLFFILACLHALWLAARGSRPRAALAWAWVLGAAACLSGIPGVLAPVFALALARLTGSQRSWGRDLTRLSPLFVVAGLALVAKLLSALVLLPEPGQGVWEWAGRVFALLPHPEGWQGGLSVAGQAVSPDRISLFLGLAGWNLLHLAAPLTLPGVYPEIFSPWPGWALAGATVLVAVALGLGMALARKDRVLVFFLVWLAAGLALASNLFPHHVLRAERYLYLPLAALAAITARGAFFASTSAAVGRAARLLPVLAGGLALLTVLSVGAWKDGPSLWSRSLAVYPDNPVAHHYLGQNLMRLGRIAEGLAQHARSFSLYGGYHPLYTRFLNHLVALGRLDDALAYARLGLSAQPDDPRWAENLALVLAARGEVREAAAGLEAFLESRPDSPGVHLSLALLYHRLGEPGRAARHLAEARRLDPLGPCPDRVQGILDARPAPEIGAKAP